MSELAASASCLEAPRTALENAAWTTPERAARSALQCLAGELGLELTAHAAETEVSAQAFAQQLVAAGRPARVVQIDERSLSDLPTPALLMLRSGAALILWRASGARVHVQLPCGRRLRMHNRELTARLSGQALDISWPIAAHGRFVVRLWRLLSHERARLSKPSVAALFALSLGLLSPYCTRILLDRVLPEADTSLLAAVVAGTLLLAGYSAWMSLLRERALLALHTALEHATCRGLYEQFVRFPFLEAQRRDLGTFSEALGSAVTLSQTLTSLVFAPLFDGVTALAYLALLCSVLPWLGVVGAVSGFGSLLIAIVSAPRLRRVQERLIDASALQVSNLHELLHGIATVKVCGAERALVARWLPRLIDARVLAIQQSRTEQWLTLGFTAARQSVSLLVFVWGARACLDAELSIGSLVASMMLADAYLGAVSRITQLVAPAFAARGKLPQLDALLRIEPEHPRIDAACSPDAGADAIILDDVWFRYTPDGPWILKGYNLRVACGEHFMLRGASGMGKTTILRLIAGLVSPERGSVRVFGKPASAQTPVVAYLPQDGLLFAGSLLSNLRVLSGASHARIRSALAATGLAELVERLPMGLETLLPPGGGSLSGGQRQLVLMTAAVASQRPLLLLDESLANLDRLTQSQLLHSELFAGKTVVSVAHDH